MVWHAVEEIDNAFDETKDLLFPLDRGVWLRLAAIVFFVGSGSSMFVSPDLFATGSSSLGEDFNQTDFEGGDFEEQITSQFSSVSTALWLGVGSFIAGFIALFGYLASVFKFVFYQSMEDGNPGIRSNLSRYKFEGLKYLLFRFGVGLGFLASFAAIVGGFFVNPGIGVLFLLIALPLWIVLWLVSFLGANLAAPETVIEDKSFFESLRSSYGLARNEWRQSGMFFLMKIVINIGISVISGLGVFAGLLILAIPLVLIGIGLAAFSKVLVLIPVMIGVLALGVIYFLVAIPLQSFVHKWIMKVNHELIGLNE